MTALTALDLAPDLVPTPEQSAIIHAARFDKHSILVNAYAGCAKTSTLEMIAAALPTGPALALAFNVKIKLEMEKRFPSHFTVKTLNGLGHSAWSQAIGKRLKVDEKKLGRLVSAVLRTAGFEASSDDWAIVRQLASHAMSQGLVPSIFPQRGLIEDSKETWADLSEGLFGTSQGVLCDFARQVIIDDVKEGFLGTISYDDQIYLSALYGGVFPRYPLVLVDEAQDLSPLNHIQVRRSAADRLIVVGDQKQSIYQFRGADHESIAKLRALRADWIELPLATTFRCPKIVVERVQAHAPGFKAFPTNPDGHIDRWDVHKSSPNGLVGPGGAEWSWDRVRAHGRPDIAILCRNNAPLLSMAFKLLRQQIGITMLGRDIGKGLIVLSKKIIPQDQTDGKACRAAIENWMQGEISLAVANGKEEKIDSIEDRGQALLAVLEGSNSGNAAALRFALAQLFAKDNGTVTLSTGHRAKGLEWGLVLHLDPWRLPSKWAKKAASKGNMAMLEQEHNLSYVIDTRSKHTLIYANLEDFQ